MARDGVNPLLGPLDGVSHENLDCFSPEMATSKTPVHKITNVPVFLYVAQA
jgi:hypothetical protein